MGGSLPRFCLVGLSNALVSFGVFALLVRLLPAAALAQAVAYSAGILWSFFWNRRWTFRHRGPLVTGFTAFVTVQLGLLCLSAALIGLAVDLLGFPPAPSWLVVMGAVTATNYLLLRFWVFARRDASRADIAVSAA